MIYQVFWPVRVRGQKYFVKVGKSFSQSLLAWGITTENGSLGKWNEILLHKSLLANSAGQVIEERSRQKRWGIIIFYPFSYEKRLLHMYCRTATWHKSQWSIYYWLQRQLKEDRRANFSFICVSVALPNIPFYFLQYPINVIRRIYTLILNS